MTRTDPNNSVIPNTSTRPMWFSTTVSVLVFIFAVCGCVTVEKGERGTDGTNVMRVMAKITGMGKDAEVENSHGTFLSAPYIEIKRPDGTVVCASNAVVNMVDYERIGGKSTIPAGVNAGANLIGAAAELGGVARP